MPTFFVHTPVGVNQMEIRKTIRAAVAEATKRGKLRPNSVDSITGQNSGDNLGTGTPVIHFEQWEHDDVEVKLVGWCWAAWPRGTQISSIPSPATPRATLAALRPQSGSGVRKKCLPHAVWQGAGPGLCARRSRRVYRQRPRTRL